jgi:hypothetical protein
MEFQALKILKTWLRAQNCQILETEGATLTIAGSQNLHGLTNPLLMLTKHTSSIIELGTGTQNAALRGNGFAPTPQCSTKMLLSGSVKERTTREDADLVLHHHKPTHSILSNVKN